jgi:PAS domain S-box-containing protein
MNRPIRILYIDDNPLDRELVRDALEKEHSGFELVDAASRADFETALTQGGFDLILSDFNVLGFDGRQVLEAVHAKDPRLPVIIVTGTGSEEIAAEAIKSGAADYVIKTPEHIQHLPHSIHAVLEKYRLEAERQQREEALRASEDKFSYVFDHSVIGKSITLPSGEINVNAAFCDLLGYGPDELKNRTWQEITHPADITLTQTMLDALLSGQKESVRFTKRFLHKNGSIRWTEIASSIRRDQGGQPLYFVTTILDITERKQAEDALAQEQSLMQTLMDIVPNRIYFKDRANRFIKISRSQAHAFGLSDPAQAIGKTDIDFFTEEHARLAYQDDQEIIRTGQPVIKEEKETWADRPDTWVSTTKLPMRDAQGNILGTFGISMDITERRQAEQALAEYSARLEADVARRTQELRDAQEQLVRQEKLAALGQLAGSVAHELRNPLGVITNAVYYLNAVQPDAEAAILDYLGLIAAEANNADKIISDLLDFARIKGVQHETVNLAVLVRGVLQKHPPAADITVVAERLDALPPVYVDPRQIEQVLTNLVVNACQAMPEGGSLTLRAELVREPLAAGPEPSGVALQVVDTGTGISPENIKKLFEPLFTTKAKGIGLGLAVSKKLIEANGGRIEVQSEPGKGSTFTAWLPLQN